MYERVEPIANILDWVEVTEEEDENAYIIDIYTIDCAVVDHVIELAYVPVRLRAVILAIEICEPF